MPPAHSDAPRNLLSSVRRLSDGELVARVKKLAAGERRATALLVAHLAELDTRDVHLREGYSSLFSYCREVLAFSEHQAYDRIEVARAVRRFPVILDLLEAATVNLTSVRLLAPHLTPHNHRAVLESARGKRTVEVKEIVARLSPRPDVPTSIRRVPRTATGPLPTSATAPFPAPATAPASAPDPAPGPAPAPTPILAPTGAPVPRSHPPAEVTPLSEERGATFVGESTRSMAPGRQLVSKRVAGRVRRHCPRPSPPGPDHGPMSAWLTPSSCGAFRIDGCSGIVYK